MKNVFIWVVKLILAILVIIGVVSVFTGIEYFGFLLVDKIGGYNFIEKYIFNEHLAAWILAFLIIQTITSLMDNIKINYNKQPKGIYKLLARWRKERNITNPDYRVYFQNIIEEILEPLGYSKEEISIIKIDIYNKYYPNELVLNENLVVDTICDIKVFSINELGTMKYNGKKCMKETIKEISSRQQDSFQKEIWDKNGASGKWLKSQEQSKDTLYIANYSKCKL
jgi:hypothetical protein